MVIITVAGMFTVVLSLGVTFVSVQKTKSGVPSLLAKNIVALANPEPLDTSYKPAPYPCAIYVGINGTLKLFGGTILKANGDGNVILNGARDCLSNGNSTCAPISCVEIYKALVGGC